jgi:hypothetical protein
MALLTEEQINDILDITNVCFSSSSAKKLLEWNEKQPSTQFEPDWDYAPERAVGATINMVWVTESGTSIFVGNIARYKKPAPVVTPHPHAEIMMKYAEVAARRVDPWVEFEIKIEKDEWIKCENFVCFDVTLDYRYIGDDK